MCVHSHIVGLRLPGPARHRSARRGEVVDLPGKGADKLGNKNICFPNQGQIDIY